MTNKFRVSGTCDELPFQVDIEADGIKDAKKKVEQKYDAHVVVVSRICSKCSGSVKFIETEGFVCNKCGWTSLF